MSGWQLIMLSAAGAVGPSGRAGTGDRDDP